MVGKFRMILLLAYAVSSALSFRLVSQQPRISVIESSYRGLPLLSKNNRDLSLWFLNRKVAEPDFFETSEETVIPPKHKEDVDMIGVKHSHPSIDQDARWMEQEGAMELLSVFAVFVVVLLAKGVFQLAI